MMTESVAYPTIDLKATGRRIADLRIARGYTVKDLQRYFRFEYPQAIYKWQWGECLPSVDNLLALARLFHVSMEDILVECSQDVLFLRLSGKPAGFAVAFRNAGGYNRESNTDNRQTAARRADPWNTVKLWTSPKR